MFKRTMLVLFVLVLAVSLTAIGCKKADEGDQPEEKGKMTILYPNWAEGIAVTHLALAALTDKGYDVTVKPIEPGPIYASLAKGDAELFLDAWLPHTHADYWKKFGDDIVKLGESFSNGTTGLVVPQYVDIDSIEDLKDVEVAKKFDKKIIGIGSGAGIHGNTEKAIKEYGLPMKQITSSGPAMMASLKKAYDRKNPVVITGWKPHFMWARYDLKYLEDPKGIYPKDVMAILARKGFKDEFPKAAEFMSNFNLKETQLYDLMGAVKEGDDPVTAAKKWYEDHKVLVNSWW